MKRLLSMLMAFTVLFLCASCGKAPEQDARASLELAKNAESEGRTEWASEVSDEVFINGKNGYENLIDGYGMGKEKYPISLPYDWSCKDYLFDTSFCYHMHGLMFLDNSYQQYLITGNEAYKKLLMDYTVDWVKNNPTIDFSNKWAWHDDATARRVLRMSLYYYLWHDDFSREDAKAIEASLKMQADLLAQESFYTEKQNHGMYQDLGLTAYALLLESGEKQRKYLSLAAERSKAYFEFCFTEDGVHSEHSPFYHRDVAKALLQFGVLFETFDPSYSAWLLSLYENTGLYLVQITMPDGSWPSLGDSSRTYENHIQSLDYHSDAFQYVVSSGQKGSPPADDIVFPQGGYAIMRSSWQDAPEDATYLLFMASTHSKTHKHGDDLGFILYHRGDLFTEAGRRDYRYLEEMTAYAYSGYAHNVLCYDDRAFPVKTGASGFQGITDAAYNTKIVAYDMDADVKSVTGVQTRFEEVAQTRTMTYDKANGVVTIKDDLDVLKAGKCSLLYHIAPGVEVQSKPDGWTLLRDGKEVADVAISANLPNAPTLATYTGGSEGEAPYRTWIFEGKSEPQIGSLLKVDALCDVGATEIVTTIALK